MKKAKLTDSCALIICIATSVLFAVLATGCGPQKSPAPIPVTSEPHSQPPSKSENSNVPVVSTVRFDERVVALLGNMSIEEKVGQLNQRPGGHGVSPNSKLTDAELALVREGKVGSYLHVAGAEATQKLQRVAVEKSRSRIPLIFGLDVVHGYRTVFPVPLALAASWNVEGVAHATSIAAKEATAAGIHWTFAPMVDIARDPRWGRVVEGAGEDPYLGSVMAAAQVRGYQGNTLKSPDTLLACAKHYLAYGAAEGGRDYNSANTSSREIFDVYMPPFLAAVDAGVGSIMTGFNDLSGIPMTMHKEMLDYLFNTGFNGFVVSDWNAVYELFNHGVVLDEQDAVMKSMAAGVHMDMRSELYSKFLPELARSGKVDNALLDEAVGRILQAKVDLGLFDNPYQYGDAQKEVKDELPKEHVATARNLAAQSMVLLKNDNALLPLNKELKTLAVIGPLADDAATQLGSWKAMGRPEDVVTFLEGIKGAVGSKTKVLYEKGCEVAGENDKQIAKAVRAAKRADAVLLFVGEDGDMSGESRSRSSIDLPGVQNKLAQAVIKTGKPVVVILVNGRPLTIPWLAEHATAILEAWLPGVQGGPALADIVFGEVNPSGKLPITFPRNVGQVPIYYAYRNTGRPADEDLSKHTCRYQDAPISPLFAFGHGLSYSPFEYQNLNVSHQENVDSNLMKVQLELTNKGKQDGVEVVQVYIRDEVASVARPIKQLVGFQRVLVPAGQTIRVEVPVPTEQLGFIGVENQFVVEPGRFQVMVGRASDDIRLIGFFDLTM